MKILITGCKGLIGSSLKRKLIELGVDVLGHDINCDIVDSDYGDILDENGLYEKVCQVDGIVHLAGVSRVIFGERYPKKCWEANVNGTQNVVDTAQNSKKKPWIIYASSREVYGQQESLPVSESAPFSPVNIYGESKIKAEQIVENARKGGIHTSIVRFSNVFGSVMDHEDRVIPAFCRAAAIGSTIRVEGHENLFDFTYLDDVIHGLIPLITCMVQGLQMPPIHYTSGKASSLGEVAQIAREASVHDIEIIEGTPRSFDVSKFCGDTNRALKLLNWQTAVSITEGMHRLINQYSFHLNESVQENILIPA